MPNIFIENRDAWLRMSDIDYLGQFVKSWLAFNAWYRSAYNENQDKKIIHEMKWQGNPVLSKLRPMLEATSEEAEQFRAEIGLLHNRLEGYEIHSGKGTEKVRITLRSVFLRDNPPATKAAKSYGYSFQVQRGANRQMTIEVKGKTGTVVLQHTQTAFNLAELQGLSQYRKLTSNLQAFLRQLYEEAAPVWICDLTTHEDLDPNAREIKCGAYAFQCGKEALFAGVIETVYQMRCTLFHGELIPTKDAVSCYEPAFRIVRRFLECVT
ncbi:MAG TPA: hypothetical protein VKD23_00285 [Terriglobales bacterium]|nr:hypothetical protein [Terriglobales bacterium]